MRFRRRIKMEQFETKAALATWADDHTGGEVVTFYNSIEGVKPVKKFEDRAVAVRRIWDALHVRADGVETPHTQATVVAVAEAVGAEATVVLNPDASLAVAKEGRAARKRKAAMQGATKKSKKAAKAKAKRASKPRKAPNADGGRAAEVLALVSRAKGVSLDELMERFGWQRHTARGFMSRFLDAYPKLKSFKTEAGVRTYRLEAK
jgi:hypothetical protein